MDKREARLRRVYENQTLAEGLRVFSVFASLLSVYAFGYMLVLAFSDDPMEALRLSLALLVPFVLVSIFRVAVNAPRPYEIFSFYEKKPHRAVGKSFPSRHAFSSFAIAVAMLAFNGLFAFLLFCVAIALSVCRYLLGVHFPRDLVAGALIGIVGTVLGLWIIF